MATAENRALKNILALGGQPGQKIRVAQDTGEDGNKAFPRQTAAEMSVRPSVEDFMQLPKIKSEEDAQRLKRILQERGREGVGEDKYNRVIRQLREFRAENPNVAGKFERDVVDHSPPEESLSEIHERTRFTGALGDISRGAIPAPDADSREGVLRSEEANGLDITSGFGEDIIDTIRMATEFNSPRARVAFLHAAVKDDLDEAGIDIPAGVEVVRINQNLGELEFLRPIGDGKVKWTLADGGLIQFKDLGALADLPDLLEMAGGILTAAATKHPFAAEFIGSAAGRNLGVVLEFLMSTGEVTAEEFKEVRNTSMRQALMNTVLSRGVIRGGRIIKNRGKPVAGDTTGQRVEDIDKNIQDAADTMDEVNALAGKGSRLRVTAAEASDSTIALQKQRGQEPTLSSNARDAIERDRIENVEILGRANDRIAANAQRSDSMKYTPYETIESVKKLQSDFGDVGVQNITPKNAPPGIELWNYRLKGDRAVKGGGEAVVGDAGVTIAILRDVQQIQITSTFRGTTFGSGTMPLLLDTIWQRNSKLIAAGYEVVSDISVTKSARRMMGRLEGSGWKVVPSPNSTDDVLRASGIDISKTGGMTRRDGGPVFAIKAAPGEILASKEVSEAVFDRQVVEATLEGMEEVLPAAQKYANDQNTLLKGVIGWSEQRQTSKYAVENLRTTPLRTTLRKLTNRLQNVLTGAEATESGKKLAIAIRREVDEDGNDVLMGLAKDELDVGNLLSARETLAVISRETKDPDMIKLVGDIDNLFKNGRILTDKGNPIADRTRAAINSAIDGSRTAQLHVDRAAASLNASNLFKRSSDGTFTHTSLQKFDSLMANDALFIQHMKPILNENVKIREQATNALHQLYKDRVLSGTGFTRGKHNTFIKRYGNAIDSILSPQQAQRLKTAPLVSGDRGLWSQFIADAAERRDDVAQLVKGISFDPTDILNSLRKVSPNRARQFMRKLKQADPRLEASLRADLIEQTRLDLHNKFFNTKVGADSLGTAKGLRDWFVKNKDTLKAVHGDQYVTDMQSIVNGHLLDARRTRVKGNTPATQGDVIRVLRSLLGPLSRPQRQITAGNYLKQKAMARKVMQVYSDPAKLRMLKAADVKGLSARSKQGISLLVRLGIFEAAGLADAENPKNLPGVQQFFDWIDTVEQEGLENAQDVEQK